MIKIHTRDGKTTRADLSDADQAKEVVKALASRDFQRTITAISVVEDAKSRIRCPSCDRTELKCLACGCELPPRAHTKAGVQYSLARPEDHDEVFFSLEEVESRDGSRGGTRVSFFAGDYRVAMMAHAGQPSARISLARTGRLRFNPSWR